MYNTNSYKFWLHFGFGSILFPIGIAYITNILSSCQSHFPEHTVLLWVILIIFVSTAAILQLPKEQLRRFHLQRKDVIRYCILLFVIATGIDFVVNSLQKNQFQNALIYLFVMAIIAIVTIFFHPISRKLKKIAQFLKSKGLLLGDFLWLSGLILTSPFQFKYYQHFKYKYRQFRGFQIDESNNNSPVLDLGKVFVPLTLGTTNTDNIVSINQQIWDFLGLSSQVRAYRRIVIIASPGSGKSTLLEHLTLTIAKNTQRQYHPKAPTLIPVVLYLRNICDKITSQQSPNLGQIITWETRKLKPPTGWFEEKLKNGECLIMLDGLDEVPRNKQRVAVSEWVNQQIERYPDNIFILTSRPFGYSHAPVKAIETVLEVQPFLFTQIEQFIYNWYLETETKYRQKYDQGIKETAKQKASQLVGKIKENQAITAIASKPLIVSMIATVDYSLGTLPHRRVELYEKIISELLRKIPGERTDKNKLVLQVLALELMRSRKYKFKIAEGCDIIKETLANVSGNMNPETFIKHIENRSSLLVEKEPGIYEFAHRSILEYLAAVGVKDSKQEHLLIQNFQDSWWSETICLYAALSDANNLIESALRNPTVETLKLACNCLSEGLSVRLELAKELQEILLLEATQNPDFAYLAAKMQLSPRIKDEDFELVGDMEAIDMTLITCEQYQLFIDDKLKFKYYQPDHWQTTRYLESSAKKPITGVRASDAIEFCKWLTQQHFTQGYKYRLPTITEAKDYPLCDTSIGYWCQDGDKHVIGGLDCIYKQAIIEQLAQFLIFKSEFDPQKFDSLFDWDIELVLKQDFYQKIHKFFDNSLQQDLKRVIDHDLYHDIYLDLNRDLNISKNLKIDLQLIINRDPNRHLNQELYLNLYLNLYRNLSLDFNLLINPDLYSGFYHDLNFLHHRDFYRNFYRELYDKISSKEASDFQILYFPLILVIVVCYLLSRIYQVASQKPEIHQAIHLTAQECNNISQKYISKSDEIFPIYAYLVLLEQRRSLLMPSWEGIRLVRERI